MVLTGTFPRDHDVDAVVPPFSPRRPGRRSALRAARLRKAAFKNLDWPNGDMLVYHRYHGGNSSSVEPAIFYSSGGLIAKPDVVEAATSNVAPLKHSVAPGPVINSTVAPPLMPIPPLTHVDSIETARQSPTRHFTHPTAALTPMLPLDHATDDPIVAVRLQHRSFSPPNSSSFQRIRSWFQSDDSVPGVSHVASDVENKSHAKDGTGEEKSHSSKSVKSNKSGRMRRQHRGTRSHRGGKSEGLMRIDTEVDENFQDWTPHDSSYGAAFPICGWIPKDVRRAIEFTLLSGVVLVLVYLVVTTSIKVRDRIDGDSSNMDISNANHNDQGSSSVPVDDAYSAADDAVAVVDDTLEEEAPYAASGWDETAAAAYSSSMPNSGGYQRSSWWRRSRNGN
jgi:hypothetical protein